MKLAQGEYVALENVENIYSGSPIVAQLYVHGDSLQSYLIAVVVPDPVQFAALATRVLGRPVAPEDSTALAAAAKDPQVVAAVHAELQKMAHKQQLKGCVFPEPCRAVGRCTDCSARCSFEMIRRLHVTMEPLTTENGCLTPTLKIRRCVFSRPAAPPRAHSRLRRFAERRRTSSSRRRLTHSTPLGSPRRPS